MIRAPPKIGKSPESRAPILCIFWVEHEFIEEKRKEHKKDLIDS